MVRGLDGCFLILLPHTWLVQFSSSTERLAKFRWCIAKGRHLFPFRTEQLSHSAPMVLGGQPPGRVGRRRFFLEECLDSPLIEGRVDVPCLRVTRIRSGMELHPSGKLGGEFL